MPAARAASRIVVPGRAVIRRPSMISVISLTGAISFAR
jgi:hypothetical protein